MFLEDEGSGVGSRGMDDLEISGSGNGDDDEDTTVKLPPPPKTTPKSAVGPIDITETGKADVGGDDINFPTGEGTNIFNHKEDTPASFFSQPGILAGKKQAVIFLMHYCNYANFTTKLANFRVLYQSSETFTENIIIIIIPLFYFTFYAVK